MIICKDVGFIHIPRTGGTSIRQALFNQPYPTYTVGCITYPAEDVRAPGNIYNPHHPPMKFYNLNGFNSLTLFAVVRNPWDRYLSWYLYTKRETENGRTFPEFMDTLFREVPTQRQVGLGRNPVTQSEYSCASRLRFLMHENLDKDWDDFCSGVGLETAPLPKLNATEKHRCRDWYSDSLIELVAEKESKIISRFDYRYTE
jgi:hypothetical protein|tara:strand:- start:143 stop:745 length:603 start_codon:yes stop_codon:yes gene_type:complete